MRGLPAGGERDERRRRRVNDTLDGNWWEQRWI